MTGKGTIIARAGARLRWPGRKCDAEAPGLAFMASAGPGERSAPGAVAPRSAILTAPGGPLGDIDDSIRRNVAVLADGAFYIHSAAISDPQARSLKDRARWLGIALKDPVPVELSVIQTISRIQAITRS